MEFKDVVKKVAKVQSKAFEDALKAKLNEGYTIDELEVEYETDIVRKSNGTISTTVKTTIKKKADDK